MIGIVVAAVVIAVLLWAVAIYLGLNRRKSLVAEAWSDVEAQLGRRAGLIPDLIASVKGHAAQERETFDELARLRGQGAADPGRRGEREAAIAANIGRVMAAAETCAELKASAAFRALESALARAEDEIHRARRHYNAAVRDFNGMIEHFPSNIVANAGGFEPAAYFQSEDPGGRAARKVAFA